MGSITTSLSTSDPELSASPSRGTKMNRCPTKVLIVTCCRGRRPSVMTMRPSSLPSAGT